MHGGLKAFNSKHRVHVLYEKIQIPEPSICIVAAILAVISLVSIVAAIKNDADDKAVDVEFLRAFSEQQD